MPKADQRKVEEPLLPGAGPGKQDADQAKQEQLEKTLDAMARKIHGIGDKEGK